MNIEKNIPIPRDNRGRKPSALVQAFEQMEVGDSVLCVGVAQGNVSSSANSFSKRVGWKFATRNTNKGVRVWRTA